jgi:hypothetical protein
MHLALQSGWVDADFAQVPEVSTGTNPVHLRLAAFLLRGAPIAEHMPVKQISNETLNQGIMLPILRLACLTSTTSSGFGDSVTKRDLAFF